MLSITNIAKSDCLTNFIHSKKANLRWCGLGLWWLVLRSVLEGQQDMLWHHPCKVIQFMFFGKKPEKTMLPRFEMVLGTDIVYGAFYILRKVRCVSHDTSHILDNPIITSEKKNPNHHMLLRDIAKSGCQFEMMWISLWWLVLRSVLAGQQDMLTHHPLQSFPVKKTCKMCYDPSNWHCSIELDISPKKNDHVAWKTF